jgi:hypothetical protein
MIDYTSLNTLKNYYGNTYPAGIKNNNSANNPILPVQSPISEIKIIDKSNNGQFDFSEAAKNFGKGLISPITSMFGSVKNFAVGAAMIAGGAALTVATGGAILPAFIALGAATGVVQAGTGIYKIATAKDGDAVEKACYDFGQATVSIGGSIAGAKASLIKINPDASKMTAFQAFTECLKPSNLQKSFTNTVEAFKSGRAWTNLGFKKPAVTPETKQNPFVEEPKPQLKVKKTPQSKENVVQAKPEPKPVVEAENSSAIIETQPESQKPQVKWEKPEYKIKQNWTKPEFKIKPEWKSQNMK